MKKNSFLAVVLVTFGLGIGFFFGMEYKAYQIRTAMKEVFTESSTSEETNSIIEQAKEEKTQPIEKKVGDEIAADTLKFTVNGVEEKQTISSGYTPKVAKEGAKFVIIDLNITNITDTEFSFFPNDGLRLVDNQEREFKVYEDTISNIKNYLNVRELSPSLMENGVIVYEIPNDATSYSLIAKTGTQKYYKVLLK